MLGLPDERLGEEVACVVMIKSGHTLTHEQLHAHLATRLAAFMIPTRAAFTYEYLPRNAAGKFMKREMPRLSFS